MLQSANRVQQPHRLLKGTWILAKRYKSKESRNFHLSPVTDVEDSSVRITPNGHCPCTMCIAHLPMLSYYVPPTCLAVPCMENSARLHGCGVCRMLHVSCCIQIERFSLRRISIRIMCCLLTSYCHIPSSLLPVTVPVCSAKAQAAVCGSTYRASYSIRIRRKGNPPFLPMHLCRCRSTSTASCAG